MKVVLSPAKNMRPVSAAGLPLSRPLFEEKTRRLAQELKAYEAWQLESLLEVNPKLAFRAFSDMQDFQWEKEGVPALLAFYGLAYQHLNPEDFTREDLLYAQDHLRILSAFYGLLRPLDGIQPYRLEMGGRLRIDGQSLYRFWGDDPCRALFADGDLVVNLASGEYAKALAAHIRPQDRLLTCRFEVHRRRKRIMLATEAKMARGEMARAIIKQRIGRPETLRDFEWGGYAFEPALSDEERYIYIKGEL